MEVVGVDIRHVFLPVMGIDWAQKRQINAVAHCHRVDIVYGGALMETFVGLAQILLFRALPYIYGVKKLMFLDPSTSEKDNRQP